MNRLAKDIERFFADLEAIEARWALVGAFAVGAWVDARSTRDVDVAVAVADDAEAERTVRALVARGYGIVATVEHTALRRLATARLLAPGGTVADLLFCSSGVEAEIVAGAARLPVVVAERVPVATLGALVAMKLLSVSPKRPRDQQDLVDLVAAATPADRAEARRLVRRIEALGAARGRDLVGDLERWLA